MKSDRLTLSSTKCGGRAEKPSIGGQFNQAIAMKDNGGSKLRMGHHSLRNGLCLIDPSRIDRT